VSLAGLSRELTGSVKTRFIRPHIQMKQLPAKSRIFRDCGGEETPPSPRASISMMVSKGLRRVNRTHFTRPQAALGFIRRHHKSIAALTRPGDVYCPKPMEISGKSLNRVRTRMPKSVESRQNTLLLIILL